MTFFVFAASSVRDSKEMMFRPWLIAGKARLESVQRERETDKQTNREREREMCLSGGAGFLVKQFFEHV